MLFAAALDHLNELSFAYGDPPPGGRALRTLDLSALAPKLAELSATWAKLKLEVIQGDPDHISEAQVVRFARFAMRVAEALGPQQMAVAQALGEFMAQAVVAAEMKQRDVIAHFALRQLGLALHDFFLVVAGFARFTQELSPRALVIGRMREVLDAHPSLPPEAEHLFRAELLLTLALDHLEASPAELARWTRAAVTATRRLTAFVQTEGWATFRADLARLVAQNEHADWTAEDLDDEFGPWPGSAAP